jgi:hypothetical protein
MIIYKYKYLTSFPTVFVGHCVIEEHAIIVQHINYYADYVMGMFFNTFPGVK